MRKSIKFVFCFSIVLLIAACAAGNTPTAATKKFFNAAIENDSKAMAEVATDETVQLMGMFGTKIQEAMKEAGITDVNKLTFTEEINGDTATVRMKSPSGEEGGEAINLVKIDGKWMVNIDMNK